MSESPKGILAYFRDFPVDGLPKCEDQANTIFEYCDKQGWDDKSIPFEMYQDRDTPGSLPPDFRKELSNDQNLENEILNSTRLGMSALLDQATLGGYSLLLVASKSVISTVPEDYAQIEKILRENGVEIKIIADASGLDFSNPDPSKKLAFAYLRVSDETQDEESQRTAIQKYVNERGYFIPKDGWFVDHGVSGSKVMPMKREGFSRMFETVQFLSPDQRPKALLISETSRIVRNSRKLVETWLDFARLGIRLQPINSIEEGLFGLEGEEEDRILNLAFIGKVNTLHSKMDSIMTKRGMENAKKRANYHCGNPPLGYDQHHCLELGHKKCYLSGALSINDLGKSVYNLLQMNPKIKVAQVKKDLGIETYIRAHRVVNSVKKFGYLTLPVKQ